MNRVLLDPAEIAEAVNLDGARAAHIHGVLKLAPGGVLKIGVVNGFAGTAEVLESTPETARLRILTRDETPPAPWCDLILALPRPRAMKRLWPELACLGVRDIHIVNAAKVEKSYFASRVTDPETYTPLLLDGLMQSGATALPRVHIHPRFNVFISDVLPALLAPATPVEGRLKIAPPLPLLAHPGPATPFHFEMNGVGAVTKFFSLDLFPLFSPDSHLYSEYSPLSSFVMRHVSSFTPLLAVGPDGGWTPDEQDAFFTAGFHPFSLGERPLRTDSACVALLAVLHYHIFYPLALSP
ncbi:MAG: 16S rRNA (uracil(1498)-N(3))-methyltransferase [Kiritimatiellaeota bacterium]|nr:16S rRNA (uracil(1498)-N(3))-methyltransferase [Kiritimatiellota bacterium]